MTVLRWLYDLIHPKAPLVVHTTDASHAEAKAAVSSAEDGLAHAVMRGETTSRVTEALRNQGDRNHFAELIEASMRSA